MKIISRERLFSLRFSYYGKPKMVPNKVFFTKGVGVHKERLASFELALRAAGVTHRNLVLVSSIYLPLLATKMGCGRLCSRQQSLSTKIT